MINPLVLNILGWSVVVLAGTMAAPALIAVAWGEWAALNTFLISALVAGFPGGALVFGFQTRGAKLTRFDSLMLLMLVWTILPIFAAAPIFFALSDINAPKALFEAVSGLTTTGATVFSDIEALPRALILWRALLQWLGGALTLLTAFLILTPSGVSGPPTQIFLPGYERGDLPRSIMATIRAIMPVYLLFTFLCVIFLWLTGIPGFDAICLSMSTISTGGFMPANGTISHYGQPMAEFVLSVFMIIGGASFIAHRAHLNRMRGGHDETTESHYFLIAIVAAVIGLTAIFWGGASEVHRLEPLEAVRQSLFRAVSLLTTTGYDNAPLTAPAVPFVLALTLTSIGGCAYSTAGGLKIYRMAMLWRQSGRELSRLVHPHGITSSQAAGRYFDIQIMKPVWVLFTVYLACAAVTAGVLALDGVSFETALMASVSALSNAGPALNMTAGPRALHVYPALSDLSQMTLAGAMILGRVELLVVMSLASVAYWRS